MQTCRRKVLLQKGRLQLKVIIIMIIIIIVIIIGSYSAPFSKEP